jgi:hypothetical protein
VVKPVSVFSYCNFGSEVIASPLVEGERIKVRDQFTVCVAFQSSLTLPLSLGKGEATQHTRRHTKPQEDK